MKNETKQKIKDLAYQIAILVLAGIAIIGTVAAIKEFNSDKKRSDRERIIVEEKIFLQDEKINKGIEVNKITHGTASWYDYDLRTEDQKCRVDDCYSMFNPTCASRDYPRGTLLKVTRLNGYNSVECRVNDYVENEDVIIDLSSYAFGRLAPLDYGLIEVSIEEIIE